MKTLIVYGTKHGCTEKCAKDLSGKLTSEVDLCNLKLAKDVDLSQYDKVIIGGSIYMGKIQKEVRKFSSENLNILRNKKVGLFICCMAEGEVSQNQIKTSFPEELIDKAVVKDYFGGEFIIKNMNFMERFIVKKVGNIEKDTLNIFDERINKFAQAMNMA